MSPSPREMAMYAEETRERVERMGVDLERVIRAREDRRRPLIDSLFRDMHSIKGGADVLDIRPVVALAHKMEDILDGFRTGRFPIDEHRADLVYSGMEYILRILENVHVAKFVDVTPVLQKIDAEL